MSLPGSAFRPVAAHLLERPPPEEDGVGRLALRTQRRHEVGLVDLRVVGHAEPTLRRIDDPIEGDVLGDDQISHLHPTGDARQVSGTVSHTAW
jgi:hypothetical protein